MSDLYRHLDVATIYWVLPLLLLYALHGMLHLCGFDDRTAAGFKRMHGTEDRILTRLGVGPVFAPAGKPARRRRRRDSTGDE